MGFESTALADVRWLVRDAATGRIEVRGPRGETLAGSLAAGGDRLFAADAPTDEAATVRFAADDGTIVTLDAMRVPDQPDLAVATDSGGRDRALATVVETIVNQVAHDVRNYAFTIGLQAELGERRAEAQPEVKAHFASVLRQIDALKAFLEKLLLYGRPVTLRPVVADPGALVRQQVQALQFGWRPDGPPVAVSVEVAPDVGQVRWDARCVSHAIFALLDNAARSADTPPPIVVTVAREGSVVTIEVSDSGTGIAPEKQAHIWSPMRVRRHGGSGLGLVTARKMAAAHGGTIELETGPSGTTARLRLPAEVAAV